MGELYMQKLVTLAVVTVLLGGCATFSSPIPENYSGPLATIKDSVKSYGVRKADLFYVTHVNEIKIEDSRSKTRQVNYGRGMNMTPVVLERKVPAQSSTVKIVGRTEYAAPILALTNTVYEISGDVKFTPEKDRAYIVKGELGENYSAVWIEDSESNVIVGEKIEIKGSAKLGTFQK
jgi:hypothetical protein